ncbi:hypothetical protein NP493_451g01034 [Ridgeia piscesae]|uniref:Uncharacterized protein n=1 Tax=Ridgeia piscesae TaxID=27915 RepID=A0AAD9KZJ9_RIDPI|nr:hypothetical protein NP493_451g01034 [Ridgeia piscesae]
MTTHVSEKLPLQYASNSIPFKASDEARRTFMPPSDSFHPLTPDKMADFVFVTAASSGHFNEMVDAIASIQTLMPRKRIYFYDIGLKAEQVAKVKKLCFVTYQYFNLSRYPKFTSTLSTYAWKPFVIETALRKHAAVFWIDASFRLKGTNMSDAYQTARTNGGFVMFHKSNHSNFAVTHAGMYRYLATDVNAQKHIEQFGSGIMLIYRTDKVYRGILWWFVRCAEVIGCIAPVYNRYCKFADRWTQFAHCHRFDQSAINIILSNIWLRDNRMRYKADESFFRVIRSPTRMYRIKTCNDVVVRKV